MGVPKLFLPEATPVWSPKGGTAMSETEETIRRYSTGTLRERVHAALRAAGHEPEVLKASDLGEADHFHIGGREATQFVAQHLHIGLGTRVLDVGSGLGGPARYFASQGAVVTGIDITAEFVDLANELDNACGMGGSITMLRHPAQHTGLAAESFDTAVLMHVGMNLGDKRGVFTEVFRVLRRGGTLGIYDLMGSNKLTYPLPWADSQDTSHVENDQTYIDHLRKAGFDVSQNIDRRQEAVAPSARMQAGKPGPLEVPMVLGDRPELRMKNVFEAIRAGKIAPRLIVALKPE